MKKTVVRITTEDTKKTYELPGEDTPQLWAAEISVACVDKNGYHRHPDSCKKTIYLERQTLIDHGLFCVMKETNNQSVPSLTAEDLILQLLECVGVFPEE